MNVTEASAWHKVVRGLKSQATDAEREAGIEAATLLNTRAYTTLHAGPSAAVVAHTFRFAHDALDDLSSPIPRTFGGSAL